MSDASMQQMETLLLRVDFCLAETSHRNETTLLFSDRELLHCLAGDLVSHHAGWVQEVVQLFIV